MKLTIINGTNRIGNRSLHISKLVQETAELHEFETYLVTLESFDTLFRGEYLTFENANEAQLKDLRAINDAKYLVFVVPTYHHGIPSPLKNFLDLVDEPELFSRNVIGIISSNKSGRDGARQAAQVINGYLAYNKAQAAYIHPEIPIINYEEPDRERIERFLNTIAGM
jgi:NAD(P)H-dependent FMN reductase